MMSSDSRYIDPAATDYNHDFLPLTRSLLLEGYAVRFAARGQSMRPIIRNNEVLTVAPLSGACLFPGDMVLHLGPDGRCYVHRLLLPGSGNAWFIKGDAMPGRPLRVASSDILGRVINRERDGKVAKFDCLMWRLAGVLLVAAAPLFIWIAPFWVRAKRWLYRRELLA